MNEKYSLNEENESEIDLKDILFLFKKNIIWIVLVALAGGLLVGGYFRFMVKPTYKATAKIYVVSASKESVINLSDLQIATNLKADYEELLLSRPVMNSILQNLSLTESVNSLQKKISIENPENTRILVLTVTYTDAQLAADIANELAELSVSWLPAIMESNAPNIVEDAVVPTAKAGPAVVKYAFVGALACAVLFMGILLIRYLMDDSIHSSEDMERYFNMTPLTVIPFDEKLSDKNGKATDIKERILKRYKDNLGKRK